ncbi:hypothetical protein [Pseudomonas sp. ANT_H12B]|uniref:hypothetical protein n=1 Tax=Pseudomonas sp. ANT_H12B TaxID=2597348 RepID=UPI0011EBB997|nr:hypothetical protein [Pseudomonas sp. ANT_H12B]KAA0961772.1 hypothetical protein FQ185_25340 [Pseudomonas sp. ANT_H12B]
MNGNKLNQTTGSMSATISTPDESFVGGSDFAIEKGSEKFYLRARMDLPDGGWRYLSFQLPLSIASNGSNNDLSLVMNPSSDTEARANYDLFSEADGVQLGSRSGKLQITYDWKTARMVGSFNFTSKTGDTVVEVTAGKFDLTGISDEVSLNEQTTGTGDFRAEISDSKTTFIADSVGFEFIEPPLEPGKSYWIIVGGKRTDLPPTSSHIAVFLRKDVDVGTYDLKSNTQVWVSYFRPDEGGFFLANAGKVKIEKLPKTGNAKGSLFASFQINENVVTVDGNFDINDEVAKA